MLILAILLSCALIASVKTYRGINAVKAEPSLFRFVEDYVCAEEQGPEGVRYTYAFTIPETLMEDDCIIFYIKHQFSEIRIDDELRFEISKNDGRHTMKTPGSYWASVKLGTADARQPAPLGFKPPD
jgi:hypothetical protein